jgi:hypothetical protein
MYDPNKLREALKVLNCTKSKNLNEVKLAYKKLAIKFHPDSNPSEEASTKFKELTSAYALLEKYMTEGGSLPVRQPAPPPPQRTQPKSRGSQPWPPPPPTARPRPSRVHVPPSQPEPFEPTPYPWWHQGPSAHDILTKLYEGELIKHAHQTGRGATQNANMGGYTTGIFLHSNMDIDTAKAIFARVFQEVDQMYPQQQQGGISYNGNNMWALPMPQTNQDPPPSEPFPFIRRVP